PAAQNRDAAALTWCPAFAGPCEVFAVTLMPPGAKKEGEPAPPRPDQAERELCALMEGYLAGRIEAFDDLYAALAGRLRGYLMTQCRDAALADDLLQDTFLQMHRSRRTYEPGRPVTPWVFAIARHVYLMHRRATARRLRFEATVAADARSDEAMHDAARALGDADAV